MPIFYNSFRQLLMPFFFCTPNTRGHRLSSVLELVHSHMVRTLIMCISRMETLLDLSLQSICQMRFSIRQKGKIR